MQKNDKKFYKKLCIQNIGNRPKNTVLKPQSTLNKNSKNIKKLMNKKIKTLNFYKN